MEPNKIKKEIIEYDVEFYKIGQSFNGLKKRHAIIKPRQLFSSTIPVSEYLKLKNKNKAKLKEKTKYLYCCEVFLEYLDNARNVLLWSNIKKNYRMRIIYNDKEAKKKKIFYFYFQTSSQMYECEEMLFGERKRDALLGPIAEDLKKLTKNVENNIIFYVILKLLAEKENAKAEKSKNRKESIKLEPRCGKSNEEKTKSRKESAKLEQRCNLSPRQLIAEKETKAKKIYEGIIENEIKNESFESHKFEPNKI